MNLTISKSEAMQWKRVMVSGLKLYKLLTKMNYPHVLTAKEMIFVVCSIPQKNTEEGN